MSVERLNLLGNEVGSLTQENNEDVHEFVVDPRKQRICLREIKQKQMAVRRHIRCLETSMESDTAAESWQFHFGPLEEAERILTAVVSEAKSFLGDREFTQALEEKNSLLPEAHNCRLRATQLSALRISTADDVSADDSVSNVGREDQRRFRCLRVS